MFFVIYLGITKIQIMKRNLLLSAFITIGLMGCNSEDDSAKKDSENNAFKAKLVGSWIYKNKIVFKNGNQEETYNYGSTICPNPYLTLNSDDTSNNVTYNADKNCDEDIDLSSWEFNNNNKEIKITSKTDNSRLVYTLTRISEDEITLRLDEENGEKIPENFDILINFDKK